MQQSSARIFGGRRSAIPTTTPADEDHVKVQYVWDLRYIDAPVLRWRDTGGDPDLDETLYYCNDANMNVTALVEPDGDVAERYVYDPYGSLVHDANGNLLVHSADWSSTEKSRNQGRSGKSALAGRILAARPPGRPKKGKRP